MREPWMMFTKEQGQELIDNTTNGWITIDGVNGIKFINKTNSSKYIFLPAGGWWEDTQYPDEQQIGIYWSTTYYGSYHAGIYLYRLIISNDEAYIDYHLPYHGYSIRAIRPLEW